jgi:hypothetical protein
MEKESKRDAIMVDEKVDEARHHGPAKTDDEPFLMVCAMSSLGTRKI